MRGRKHPDPSFILLVRPSLRYFGGDQIGSEIEIWVKKRNSYEEVLEVLFRFGDEPSMANNFAFYHVDHFFRNIGGMVSDPLKVAGNQ